MILLLSRAEYTAICLYATLFFSVIVLLAFIWIIVYLVKQNRKHILTHDEIEAILSVHTSKAAKFIYDTCPDFPDKKQVRKLYRNIYSQDKLIIYHFDKHVYETIKAKYYKIKQHAEEEN